MSASYRNITLYGISDMHVCGKVHHAFGNKWKGAICMPSLSATVNCDSGPGVPFKGRVAAIFKQPKIEIL